MHKVAEMVSVPNEVRRGLVGRICRNKEYREKPYLIRHLLTAIFQSCLEADAKLVKSMAASRRNSRRSNAQVCEQASVQERRKE